MKPSNLALINEAFTSQAESFDTAEPNARDIAALFMPGYTRKIS